MKRVTLIAAATVVDAVAGDPEGWPHPVRVMGAAIAQGEQALRRSEQSAREEFAAGAGLSFAIVGASYFATKLLVKAAARRPAIGALVELYFAWTCLAARNLRDEADAVVRALEAGDISAARLRLARIVGRDTAHLDAAGISRAAIETVAESASDGVIAPLFYLALGGAPLAMAYKAVNTLDSMIGHADERYLHFGKFAARLDDAANYIPARLTALAIACAATPFGNAAQALRLWHRDGDRHKSPNAGQPEAAMSGALQVRLGGVNTYAGEVIDAPEMGREFRSPTAPDARRSIALMLGASAIAATTFALACCVAPRCLRGRP